jgi:integrase
MVLIAGGLGLRVSEIVGLQWQDFDFEAGTLLVQRSIVHGRVGETKTEYSNDRVPLDASLIDALRKHQAASSKTPNEWVFANPSTSRPYHQEEIQKRYIRKAAKAAGITEPIGWHSFRHSYRTWLEQVGAPLSVQQALMRHASITTTMNTYGRTPDTAKMVAHSAVVGLLIPNSQAAQS